MALARAPTAGTGQRWPFTGVWRDIRIQISEQALDVFCSIIAFDPELPSIVGFNLTSSLSSNL
jgi:hypothetical protein